MTREGKRPIPFVQGTIACLLVGAGLFSFVGLVDLVLSIDDMAIENPIRTHVEVEADDASFRATLSATQRDRPLVRLEVRGDEDSLRTLHFEMHSQGASRD